VGAAVNGPAVGGGVELVGACDLAVAADHAWFSMNSVRVGSAPVLGGAGVLALAMGEKHAREAMLLGGRHSAADAMARGWVNRVVPRADLETEVDTIVAELAKASPRSLEIAKMSANVWWNLSRHSMVAGLEALVRSFSSGDLHEGAQALLERRHEPPLARPGGPMDLGLKDRVAIVTGAGRGLGHAIATALAEEGVTVVGTARTRNGLDAVDAIADHTIGVEFDARDPDGATALVDSALDRAGRVDIVVNNAGIAPTGTLETQGLAALRDVLEVNLMTPVALALAALPAKSWLDDIAAYHRVYSRQQRHLAEVPASDADHIVEWLTESVGVSFALPDLTGEGLQFRGARLLVAEGKPVGELLYRNDDDDVIAICFMKASNKAPGTKTQGLDETIRDDIGLISWTRPNASYVVVGPSSEATLTQIAEKASSPL